MIIDLKIFMIIIGFIIIIRSTVGVLLPHMIHVDNISLFQIIFLSMSGILTLFFAVYYADEKLSFLRQRVEKLINNNPSSPIPKCNSRCLFKNIYYFFNNLELIIQNYNDLINQQNTLLDKYSLVNSKLKKSNQVRDIMLEVSHSTVAIDNTEELFKLILEKLISTIDDADKGSFIIINEDNLVEYKAAVGFDMNKLKDIKFKLEETFLWQKSLGNISGPYIIKDIRSFDFSTLTPETYNSLESIKALDIKTTLSTPIIIDNSLYGMINIDSLNIDAFNEEDLLVAEYFSNQISIAIKNHQLLERIVYLSRYDNMTNAFNRCYFEELLDNFYKKALRYNEPFCLVIFDLNNLKFINDTYGHVTGDMVITKFAKVLQENIRDSDLFARYGGDEFIGVFFNSTPDDLQKRLDLIIQRFNSSPILVNHDKVFITFSYGISCFPEDSRDINDLIKLADKKMYKYKKKFK